MDVRMVSRIKMILWVILLVGIAIIFIQREEIGEWLMSVLSSDTDSQLQQLLR